MSTIRVDAVGQEAIDRAKALLSGVESGVEKVLHGAMTRSVSHLRANTAKAIQKRYAISTANIRANENVKVQYSYQNGVQAVVTFYGRKIPLYRYDGTSPKLPTQDTSKWVQAMIDGEAKWVHPSVPVYGHQFTSTAPAYQGDEAFVAQMKSGHIGIFKRTGGSSSTDGEEIKEIMGSSVPQMLGSEKVKEKLSNETMQKFEERLDHEILTIMNGWR